MEQHVRSGSHGYRELLLYDADEIAMPITEFLLKKCGAERV